MFCPECGKQLTENNIKECPFCGHQIDIPEISNDEYVVLEKELGTPDIKTDDKKRNKISYKSLVIIIGAIVLLIAIVITIINLIRFNTINYEKFSENWEMVSMIMINIK